MVRECLLLLGVVLDVSLWNDMKQKDIICLENIERIYYFMFVVSVCVVDVMKML